MRTDFSVQDCRICFFTVFAESDGRDLLEKKFRISKEDIAFDSPVPAVREILRNDRGNFPQLKRNGLDLLQFIFLCDLLDRRAFCPPESTGQSFFGYEDRPGVPDETDIPSRVFRVRDQNTIQGVPSSTISYI